MEQKGVDFELVVIDDGSTDHSPDILEKLQGELGFRYIHRENKGFVPTMNELLSLARGKYFCSFASDDIMPPDRLKKQSDFMERHPRSVACFGQIKTLSPEGDVSAEVVPLYMKNVPEVSFEQVLVSDRAIHGCSEMLLTEAVRSLGGYDTRFYFEDMPLYLALLYKYGPQPASADFVCCYYRVHGSNMHGDHGRMYREILRLLDLYKGHKLYRTACRRWKARWFSTLAYKDRGEAFRMLPKLASFSPSFLLRLPKLFIPKRFLKC
jgi:alpha-1,3-rhamnosyltransferase